MDASHGCERRSQRAREAALERPQAPRPPEVGDAHGAFGAERQPDDSLLRPARARRAPPPSRRPARRGRETPAPAARRSRARSPCRTAARRRAARIRPPTGSRHVRGRTRGHAPQPRRRGSETARATRPPSRTGRAGPCNSLFPVPISHTVSRRLHVERGDHRRDDRGRRRGLAAADRQRDVAPGDVGEALRHEQRARHALQRAQKLDVLDALGAHRQGELGALFRLRRAQALSPREASRSVTESRTPSPILAGIRRR